MNAARERVKKKLWSYGYRVKDMHEQGIADIVGFDLLVADQYKVHVRTDKKRLVTSEDGQLCTVVVRGNTITYYTQYGRHSSPLKAFPNVDTLNTKTTKHHVESTKHTT